MGITVLSAPAASASMPGINALSAAPGLAADGIPIDFAALLTGQIAGLPQAATNVSSTSSARASKEDADLEDNLISDILFAQDPVQAAQNVIPNIAPAIENRLQLDVDRNGLLSSSKQLDMALMAEAQKGAKESTTTPAAALPELATNTVEPLDKTKQLVASISSEHQNQLTSPFTLALQTTNIQADTTGSQTQTTTNTNQVSLPSLSEFTQKTSNVTANLAAETNSGNSTTNTFATMLAGQSAQGQQAQQTAPTGNPTVTTPLQDNAWAHDFSERIAWVAKNDQQVAQINISPAQLGPVQITLNMNGDQASIAFASPHAEVRKAIEDAMPNLREMLASSGINLGQSNVGAQLQQQQRELPGQFANGTRAAGENAILPADSRSGSISSSLPIQRGRGLVDLFA